MINFYDLDFKRVAMHQIIAKSDGMEHASVMPDKNLFHLTDEVINVIKERLAKTTDKVSKAFVLELENYVGGSFFSYIHKLKHQSHSDFVESSVAVAELLAESQTKNSIPGGFFILIEAYTKTLEAVYIAIKAEYQSGLRYEIYEQKSTIQLLDDIFLNNSAKFYKVGVIFERPVPDSELEYPNNEFGSYLFDAQFAPDSKPAEYFYKDFLGFTADKNAKIQSLRFFKQTENFIHNYIPAFDEKNDLLTVLKQEFTTNEEEAINPIDFAKTYIHNNEIRDNYYNEVATYIPEMVVKDTSLIRSQLEKKKLTFANKVAITAPERTFDYSVRMIKSKEELDEIDWNAHEFTLIMINGKPIIE